MLGGAGTDWVGIGVIGAKALLESFDLLFLLGASSGERDEVR
jgi:hypothetical protein